MALSAGRAAMWLIAVGIALSMTITCAVEGVSSFPFEWYGILIGSGLAIVAFLLGLVE